MAKDRVQPLKLEYPETGGSETDVTPTAVDRNEDFYDGRGITIQSNVSDDTDVVIERDVDDSMVFSDLVSGTYTLADLVAGGFDINNAIFDVAGGFVYANDERIVTRN